MIEKVPHIKKMFRKITAELPGVTLSVQRPSIQEVKIDFDGVKLVTKPANQYTLDIGSSRLFHFTDVWDAIYGKNYEALAKVLKVLHNFKGAQFRDFKHPKKKRLDAKKNIGYTIENNETITVINIRAASRRIL